MEELLNLKSESAVKEAKEQYRVVRSRSRVYRSAITLKGLYTFNAFLLGIFLLISAIPTVLLLLNFVKQSSGSALQFIAGLGLAFFYPLTFFTLLTLLVNIAIIYLLALGVRKDWPLLTGAISLLTATGHILVLSFIAFCLIVISTQSQTPDALTILVGMIRSVASVNVGVLVLTIFLQTLITIYFLAFLINGLGGFRETLIATPLSTFFPSGVLVEAARKGDVESLMKIYYASQRVANSGKSSYELWKQLMKKVDLEKDVRVARVDEDVVGFLITAQEFRTVKSVHLSGGAIADEAEECLLRDFVRLYSRSVQYVDFVEVSSSDKKLQKALSHNGWTKSESASSSRKVSFRYGDNFEVSPLPSKTI
jgi:hypothetical protein